jgi:hypothetical protein
MSTKLPHRLRVVSWLARNRGLYAPNSRVRSRVTPAGRGKGSAPEGIGNEHEDVATPAQRMTWAQRLRRVFRIDVDKSAGQPICTAEGCRIGVGYKDVPDETCPRCGGAVKIIASIEEDAVIEKILAHVDAQVQRPKADTLPPSRAPLQLEIDDDWL